MNPKLKTLIVEDNPSDADLLVMALERGGFDVTFERVDTPESFQNALDSEQWDMIFSDHSMPRFSSFEALRLRNQAGVDAPFIILSGTMGEDLAVEAMRAGASDYFVKGNFTRLAPVVNRELEDAKQRDRRRKTEWELEHFVASLTHDLRTPILAEARILSLLSEGKFGSLNTEQQDVIRELFQSNQFMNHMVQNILFTYKYKQRQVVLNKEKTDLRLFAEELVASMAVQSLLQEKHHHLKLELDESIPSISMDRHEIHRVLLNLIKNAVDHTPDKDTITLAVKVNDTAKRIRVEIRDTGSGVDPQLEPYLFTMYAPAHVKKYRKLGLGLGLFLSKKIIETHGGNMGYEKLSPGSSFYFELSIST